jgi:alpha-1,2-mannosyltransferase
MAGLTFAITEPALLFADFRLAYYRAGAQVIRAPHEIASIMGVEVHGLTNIPIVAYLFAPFALLPVSTAALLFTLLGCAAILLTWRLLVRLASLGTYESAVLLFLLAASGPMWYGMREGNTSHFVLLAIVVAMGLMRAGRDFTAGVLLGAAAIIKLPLLLIGVYMLLRGRWRAATGGAVACAGLALASLAWYERCVAPYSGAALTAYNVQSVPSTLARIGEGPSALADWTIRPLRPAQRRTAQAITALLCVAAVAASLRRGAGKLGPARVVPRDVTFELEFMMVLALAVLTTPLAWSHYFIFLFLPLAFIFGQTEHFAVDRHRCRQLAWVAAALMTVPVLLPRLPGGWIATLYAQVFASSLLFGGMLMFALLVRAVAGANRHGRRAAAAYDNGEPALVAPNQDGNPRKADSHRTPHDGPPAQGTLRDR